jgi:hypothetical protein
VQVSAVSDQLGMEDIGVNPGELDDDEGGGLVGEQTSFVISCLNPLVFLLVSEATWFISTKM